MPKIGRGRCPAGVVWFSRTLGGWEFSAAIRKAELLLAASCSSISMSADVDDREGLVNFYAHADTHHSMCLEVGGTRVDLRRVRKR